MYVFSEIFCFYINFFLKQQLWCEHSYFSVNILGVETLEANCQKTKQKKNYLLLMTVQCQWHYKISTVRCPGRLTLNFKFKSLNSEITRRSCVMKKNRIQKIDWDGSFKQLQVFRNTILNLCAEFLKLNFAKIFNVSPYLLIKIFMCSVGVSLLPGVNFSMLGVEPEARECHEHGQASHS